MSNTQPVMRNMLEIAQDEFIMRDRILDILKDGPKTIPEITELMDYPNREVTIWLSGLRRYGFIEEVGRADLDGYFKYELKEQEPKPAE